MSIDYFGLMTSSKRIPISVFGLIAFVSKADDTRITLFILSSVFTLQEVFLPAVKISAQETELREGYGALGKKISTKLPIGRILVIVKWMA